MMFVNIPPKYTYFPPGYLTAEAKFTEKETEEFLQVQLLLEQKREAVIAKREEFKHSWYRRECNALGPSRKPVQRN